jgi:Matrixin
MQNRNRNVFGKATSTRGIFGLVALCALVTACGSSHSGSSGSSDASADAARDKTVTPPKAYYDALLVERMNLAGSGALATAQTQVLWVNFNGATVKQGYNRGESFIPCSDSVTIRPSGLSKNDQETIIKKLAEYYSNAGVKLSVTYDKPTSGDFTTIHVGGNYSDLGCRGGSSVAGIAPYDVDNANPNDIGFVFLKSNKVGALAQTIAHESGHSFGLDHTDNVKDIMYPVERSEVQGFAIGKAEGTGDEQNGPEVLQANVGSGSATVSGVPVIPTSPVPVVVLPTPVVIPGLPVIPTTPSSFPGLGNLGGLASILSALPPSLTASLANILPTLNTGAFPGSGAVPNAQGAFAILTALQNATMGQNNGQFNMGQIVSMVTSFTPININQFLSLGGILGAIGTGQNGPTPINITGLTSAVSGQVPTAINLAQLLGLASIGNPGTLIALLPQYSQIIGSNAQGANAQALLSIIMMGIGQQYNANQTVP